MNEIWPMDPLLQKLLRPERPREGVIYRPSLYAWIFERDGRRYAVHGVTQQCVEAALPAACRAGEGYDDLIAARFLVPEGKDECAFYEGVSAMLRAYQRPKGHPGFTILPTLRCNARCVYCYEEGMAQTTMTPETVEQVIRFIRDSHAEEPVFLNWFGGEPLLCPTIIDRICEGLREAGLDYDGEMVTNGSLITLQILDKMTGPWRISKLQIPLDGAEADYIARKRYAAAGDQYHRVIENIRRAAEAGLRVTIRCNADPDNWKGMPAMLEDLKRGIPDKRNVSFYFCALNSVRQSEADLDMWRRFLAMEPLVREAGFGMAGSPDGLLRVFHCMADGNSVVICPDGSLYPCEHCPPQARLGDIWHGVTDEPARKAFCEALETREKCRQCPYLPECTSFSACPIQDRHCREIKDLGRPFLPEMVLERRRNAQDTISC